MKDEMGLVPVCHFVAARGAGYFDCYPKYYSQHSKRVTDEEDDICVDEVDARVCELCDGAVNPEAQSNGD